MNELLEFRSNADRDKADKIPTMTYRELTQYLRVLEEEKSFLDGLLEKYLIQDTLLENEIDEMIKKIALDKSKDMIKNLQIIVQRFQMAKENIGTSYDRNIGRGVTFKSVLCNKTYEKICKYNGQKLHSSNNAKMFLYKTNEAIFRVKQKI